MWLLEELTPSGQFYTLTPERLRVEPNLQSQGQQPLQQSSIKLFRKVRLELILFRGLGGVQR